LLEGVPPDQVRELLQIARRRRFSRNEVVFHRDDPGDSLHLIQKGRFAVRVMTPLGNIATLAILGPGECFGEMALLTGSPRSTTVAALEEAETFAVYRTDFEHLRKRHRSVDDLLLRVFSNLVGSLNERLLESLYVPAEKRVVRRLVELAALYPGSENGHVIALTQEVLAELAGTSRATVNQVLRGEEKRGTIELLRGRTRIVDLEALQKRAR